MNEPTYEELEFPSFVNTRTAITVTAYDDAGNKETIDLPLADAHKIAVVSGCSFLNVGDTRCGKSQVMMDIHRNYFGGDADSGGRSNWNVARNDFTADAYFMTIDQSKVGEGKGILAEARVPVTRRLKALSNAVDEINLAIPEIQVEFFGMAEGRHKGLELGDRGYHLFMAACNFDRVNGDFVGTSQINRALLNRFGVTFDFDYFKKTDKDDDLLAERDVSGRLNLAPIRDISDKILAAYEKIKTASAQRDPWLDAYIRVFSSALEYCNKDRDKLKKKTWPSQCGGCTFMEKDTSKLCHLVKQSNTGTTGMLKRFANGINYLVQLKHGKRNVEPFDLAFEAFKFTTYHGNLNKREIESTYGGEDQEQMRDVVERMRDAIKPLTHYINQSIESAVDQGVSETRFIRISPGPRENIIPYSDAGIKRLEQIKNEKSVSYVVFDPFSEKKGGKSFEERTGLRMDWFPNYLSTIANRYHK